MARQKLFFVKFKVFSTKNPNVRWKPAFTKGVVSAKTPTEAQEKAYKKRVEEIQLQFPDADLKPVGTAKNLSADFLY